MEISSERSAAKVELASVLVRSIRELRIELASALVRSTRELRIELASELVQSTGELRLRAMGTSMLPSIRPGDELLIRRCDVETVAAGDIVLYARDGRMFVHRVIARTSRGLVTQGDAVAASDPLVRPGELLGKVIAVSRIGKPALPPPQMTLSRRIVAVAIRHSEIFARLVDRLCARSRRVSA